MAAHGGTVQLPPGSMAPGLSVNEEVDEYEKILKISDDIFSGAHPRLKVPQQFVRKSTTQTAQKSPVPRTEAAKTTSKGPTQTDARMPGPSKILTSPKESAGGATTPQSSRVAPKTPSEIDPIFLTKSEELVRAETQLQRSRVEKVLREQLEQRRLESKQRIAPQDRKPDFNVSDVLDRALELVRPSPPREVHEANKAASDSFDENSLYSSRAPDSPPGYQPRPTPPPAHSGSLASHVPVDHYPDELRRLESLNNNGTDQQMQDAYPVADQRLRSQRKPSYNPQPDMPGTSSFESQQQSDAFEDDYSPPAPGVPPMERADSRLQQMPYASGARQQALSGQAPNRRRYSRSSQSPSDNVRIVRNHITSPAAPRPSKVSPLATLKSPTVQRLKPSQPAHGSRARPDQQTDRGSPEAPPEGTRPMPRKRRRLQEEREGPRRASRKKQEVDAPETSVKQEPVSPPPFADDPPNVGRVPQEPVYVDIAPPRYTPVIERRPLPREPAYEVDPYDPRGLRAVSRLSTRQPMRDDQDLRRVASLQHARQPAYAREYVDQPTNQSVRASSFAMVERPPQDGAGYYDEPVAPYHRRFVPVDDQVPRYREVYLDEEVPQRVMAPPERRIVVDEHGNRFYEILPAPRLEPMPPPPARAPRGEFYEDHASMGGASVRAGSVVEDPYSGRRYVQEMPRPQSTYRRVTDFAQPAPSERRAYSVRMDDQAGIPRSGSVQVGEYPPRRTAYVDGPEPRERMIRMASVRPSAARYEEPREIVQRVGSVVPRSRAASTFVEDDTRRPREYIERPRYTGEKRYYDGNNGDLVYLDAQGRY